MSDIKYSLEFNSSPSELYNAIIDSEKHSAFTGAPAQIEPIEGGSLSTFNGHIVGTITKLEENSLIKMDWRPTPWPEGVVSKVQFKFKELGGRTKLEFIHTGVPEEAIDMIKQGWETNYWDKLPNFLSK